MRKPCLNQEGKERQQRQGGQPSRFFREIPEMDPLFPKSRNCVIFPEKKNHRKQQDVTDNDTSSTTIYPLDYQNLGQLALSVFAIPHSNALAEKIFSLVRKNRTESRPQLSNATLNTLFL